MFRNGFASAGVVLAFVFLPARTALAADYAFGNVAAEAKVMRDGECPATVVLNGVFDAYRPHVGNYQWQFSDGTKTDKKMYTVRAEKVHAVADTREFSAAGEQSVKLCVASTYPQPICSEAVRFHINCSRGTETPRASGSVSGNIGAVATHNLDSGASVGSIRGAEPVMGKWTVRAKDNSGVTWNGSLEISAGDAGLDCEFSVSSPEGGKGIGGPCNYNPGPRAVSGTGGKYSYSARLSPDGEALQIGKWSCETDSATWAGRR
ncbi:MAG: hypothetical protein LAQ30_28655 [Acidobacteriia bacterium]|nr:hypothetical protein [Terriglobia bacterium]